MEKVAASKTGIVGRGVALLLGVHGLEAGKVKVHAVDDAVCRDTDGMICLTVLLLLELIELSFCSKVLTFCSHYF